MDKAELWGQDLALYREGIGTIDMEAEIFYGAMRDGSHFIWMCVIEENPMDMNLNGLSLSLVLLESVRPDFYKKEQGDYHNKAQKYLEWREIARQKIPDKDPDKATKEEAKKKAQAKLMQVQAGLYKTLYQIIDDYGETHNTTLNRAIGKALALVIKNEAMVDSKSKADIQSLINVLEPVVTEAVKAVEQIELSEQIKE